jgi:hypothetical protein
MTNNFAKYQELRRGVIQEIFDYVSEKECGDIHNSEDEYYDLPRTYHVDKYSYYNEYAILGVRIEYDKLIFDGFGLGDNYGHDMEFHEYEISTPVLMEILDELYRIPEPTKPQSHE